MVYLTLSEKTLGKQVSLPSDFFLPSYLGATLGKEVVSSFQAMPLGKPL
jgi:hypothetical protein